MVPLVAAHVHRQPFPHLRAIDESIVIFVIFRKHGWKHLLELFQRNIAILVQVRFLKNVSQMDSSHTLQ